MKNSAAKKERRKYPRIKMRGMAIAKAHSSTLPPGTITEISLSGLAFQYRVSGSCRSVVRKIDIIWADYVAAHHLRGLPIKSVSDVILDHGRQDVAGITRQKAVKFEHLSADQKIALDRLIREQGSAAS